jgi:CheY-like chemotaxis protein
MLDHEDLKWLATTSTELNSLLQQISRYSDLARQHKGEFSYIELLSDRVELASKASQALFDRVTSRILSGTGGGPAAPKTAPTSRTPSFTVMPPPGAAEPAKKAKSPTVTRKIPVGEMKVDARDAEKSSAAPIRNPDGTRELILLVDDEPEISDLAAEMLAKEGYRIILAKDGFEALQIYQKQRKEIGLVILDFFLPVMDGDAVFDELKSINPKVNVVLSSGFAEQTKLGQMLARGLRGFIPKPYAREKLLEQVRSTLDAAANG